MRGDSCLQDTAVGKFRTMRGGMRLMLDAIGIERA